jgi:hypothetical protein
MTRLTAVAAVVGWVATIIVLGQSGASLAVPALAGWSVSAVIGIDASRRRERVPTLIAVGIAASAVLFVAVAAIAI